ncbi:hypothetical protein [[Flexibacter] sp. ATCC 35208]|uniref:hypothetical protein n=1 Tax=[Flexibacter] sp. ATCC 35208 TaxID=1936242 RepID=UPI0009D35BDC|nr:hypothetical protein [[Flexibacter] sp. ATCC 35208]OMP75638.1 hypothetical protein BW716_29320 [[Flexibacter] sp. ATCC 35208]
MKQIFCKLAAVSLCSLLLFSCAKNENNLDPLIKETSNEKETISYHLTKEQYDFLNSVFENDNRRDSFFTVLKNNSAN